MHQHIYDLRSMPFWLLKIYIEEVGGILQENGWYIGQGWKARIEKMDDFQIGSLSVSQVRLEWWGNEDAIKEILPKLEKKLIRAGG